MMDYLINRMMNPVRRNRLVDLKVGMKNPADGRSLKPGTLRKNSLSSRAEGEKVTYYGKRNKAETEAYFTVEAALVVPIVLGIFVMIIYLSFYLYDRCVLAQDCYVLSYRQSIEKGKADRAGEAAAREQFGQKLFMLSRLEAGASKGGTIRVKANAAMEPPLFGLDFFREERYWILGVQEKARSTDPPRDYRRVRRLLYLASHVLNQGGGQDN